MNNLRIQQTNSLRSEARGNDGLTGAERGARADRYASRNARPLIGKPALDAHNARRAARRAAC